METQIIEEIQNPLFNRKEVVLKTKAEHNPSKKEIADLLSEKFSSDAKNIEIKKIEGKFGVKTFTITAHIYSSEKDKEKTILKSKNKKNKIEK